jgi:hypothetical protein
MFLSDRPLDGRALMESGAEIAGGAVGSALAFLATGADRRGMPVQSPSCWPVLMSATGCHKPPSCPCTGRPSRRRCRGLIRLLQQVSLTAPSPFGTVRPL